VHSTAKLRAEAILKLRARQQRIQSEAPKLSPYRRFQERYANDRVSFVHDCLNWPEGRGPAPYQDEILGMIDTHDRVAARGPHGLGKSALASWTVIHWALVNDELFDWKAITTASVWRQLTKYLWPEIHKWVKALNWQKIGRGGFERLEFLTMQMSLTTGQAFAVASDDPATIEGAHADRLLYLFDEAKIIPDATWDSAEGAFSNAGNEQGALAKALAVSTPGAPSGRFYEIHQRKPGTEDWKVRHVTLEECIKAGRISKAWADQRRKQWGAQSALYLNRVEGEFAASDEAGVIPLAWVERAVERWKAWQDELETQLAGLPAFERNKARRELLGSPDALAADISDGGADPGVIGRRYDLKAELEYLEGLDTMEQAGRIVRAVRWHNPGRVAGDASGVGAGTVRRVREQDIEIEGFNGSHSAEEYTDRSGELEFLNMRAAAFWNLRELLDPDNGFDIALPEDDRLVGDLTAPRVKETSSGKIQIERKEDIRTRLGRSPDAGDMISILYADLIPLRTSDDPPPPTATDFLAALQAAAGR
jgi:hypothetical protein